MAIYQTRRYLIDAVNGLELPMGRYIESECEEWVKRFGVDLLPTDANPTGSGFIIQTLTRLKEELIPPPNQDFKTLDQALSTLSNPSEVVTPPLKRAIRKKMVP